LTTSDIVLLSQSLTTLTILLQYSPASSFPEVESIVLQDIYPLAHSNLVSGTCLDSLLGFFGALVEADGQIASHLIPGLVTSLKKADPKFSVPGNVAKVVSRIVRNQISVAAGVIAEFTKSLKVRVSPCLLCDILTRGFKGRCQGSRLTSRFKSPRPWRIGSFHVGMFQFSPSLFINDFPVI